MTPTTLPLVLTAPRGVQRTLGGLSRALLVGLTAFLTVVDLFATQAILPALTRAYGTTPAMMSFAVNASTIGMAVSGLAMSLIGRRIDRRWGILLCLGLLSMPTLSLASMPDLAVFAMQPSSLNRRPRWKGRLVNLARDNQVYRAGRPGDLGCLFGPTRQVVSRRCFDFQHCRNGRSRTRALVRRGSPKRLEEKAIRRPVAFRVENATGCASDPRGCGTASCWPTALKREGKRPQFRRWL